MTEHWQIPHELPDLRRVDNNLVAIDTEENDEGLREGHGSGWPWRGGWVCGLSVAWRAGCVMHAIYVPIRHPESVNFDPAQVSHWLRDLVAAGVRFVTLNGPFDWAWLATDLGVAMPPSSQIEEVGVLAALVDENQFAYSLDALCKRHDLPGKDTALLEAAVKAAGFKISKKTPLQSYIWQMPAHVIGPYGEADPIATLLLFETLMPIVDREGSGDAYRLERDLMQVTIAMRRKGIRANQDAAEQARDEFLAKRDAALKALSDRHGALIGMDEINSPKWKIATFERYGIHVPHTTPTGAPSFKAGNSGWMGGHEHWLPSGIARASKYDAAACKFLQGHIIDHIIGGRIYAEFHQFKSEDGGTKSLRFSVSSPPLQQMPTRDPEIGPPIRRIFEAEEGCYCAKSDISQQEFRILVDKAERHALAGAKEAGDNYRNNPEADYHKFVADITGLERAVAKPTNFMKIYGGGAPSIAMKTGLSLEKAQECMRQYDARLPFVKKLSQIHQSQAERTGITEIMGGALRHWNRYEAPWRSDKKKDTGPCSLEEAQLRVLDPGHPWHNQKLQRAKTYRALNAAIQGDAAVHTKRWMLDCFREGIVPSLQMHDELVCSVTTREEGEMIARLGEEAIKLSVPMRVDLKFGKSWGEARHSWDEVAGGRRSGTIHRSETLAAKPTIILPASSPSEAAMPIDPRVPNEQLIPLHCLDGEIEPEGEAPQAPGKANGHDQSPPHEPPSTAIDDHQVWVTIFPDEFAASLKHGFLTLPRIAALIHVTTAASKGALPWIKLQRFGDKATVRNCLRNDANVVEISGLEGEHDAGTLSFADAVAALRKADIRCIVYTSPSYVPGTKERWRVLVPLSKSCPPFFRVGLLARLNGILGGHLAPESFTLSQAYYYGSVDNNSNHQVEVLDGDFIDQRNDLAAGAIFKDGSKAGEPASGSHAKSDASGERKPSAPWEDPILKILAGDQLHDSIRDLAAKLIAAGTDPAAVENILRGLMEKSRAERDQRWQDRYNDIPRAVSSAEEKYAPTPAGDLSSLFAQLKGGPGTGAGTGPGGAGTGATTGATATPPLIEARAFVLRDPKTLTKRDWIYGTHLIRKFGSATFAPSGSGKSNLMIAEALAIVTQRPLLGILPPKRCRVWYWNGEDPFDELERRVGAACLHYGISQEEIEGWLFVNSGRDQGSKVVIAKQDKNGTTIAIPTVDALVATIRANQIDVVMIDPFISSHQVTENDNNAIDVVAKAWTTIADVTDTALDLAHHTRKTGGAAVTVEDGRGASALLSAVRPARVLNVMTEDEAIKAGIADGRRRYFKVEDGKNNLALPPDKLEWYRSESIFLGNGDPNVVGDKGDDMGVVTAWEWPAVVEVAPGELEKVKEAIRAGEWRRNNNAAEWVGHAVAKALGLGDVRKKGLDRTKVTTLVNTWIHKEVLKVVVRDDKKRMPKEYVEVAENAEAD